MDTRKTHYRQPDAQRHLFPLLRKENIQAKIRPDGDSVPVLGNHLPPAGYALLCVERAFPEGGE